ncbi:Golgin subfamily A member 7/ERF4 family-domain-containing protein [Lenzites betulinus]|nr:Golgin subfamily A member 7/ERF4 family-domain-containing protein [Lenzites betulinus]
MSSNARPGSPSAALAVPAQAPLHEASTSPRASPVPPTPPPKDYAFIQDEHHPHSSAAEKMSRLGFRAAPPEIEPADMDMVIDISRPFGADADAESVAEEADTTLRASTDADGHALRKEDGELEDAEPDDPTEADITTEHRRSDSPTEPEGEHGGSTLYGSGAGSERERAREQERELEREHVQEHPLRLDVHPPSPLPWDVQDEAERGRISPQRFEFSAAKKRTLHEFASKPVRSHNRPLIPHSAYYFGPPPPDAAYGTDPIGQIGVHYPREVVRVERDYSGGELPQFAPTYPLELEGRITPTQFLETINAINEILLSAHSLGHAFVDNALAFLSLQASRAIKRSHYEKEMERLKATMDMLNEQVYNPVGLHLRWPRSVAFLFLEIEYYRPSYMFPPCPVASSRVCQGRRH